MEASTAYIPGEITGTQRATPAPLSRYLPPLPKGVVSSWLQTHIPVGSWVLEPFGASPALAIEAARAGYRLLVAVNNPITRFLFEMQATAPGEEELRAALALLASTRKGEERLEHHLLGLYLTPCAHCGQEVSAQAFLWEREKESPYARIYTCPHCGDGGERPVTEADEARAAQFARLSVIQRARALERVAPLHDPDREHVEQSLKVYPPRAIYGLFTLINRLEGMSLPPRQRDLLILLLIAAFDRANTLWPHPTARARPKQLTIPPHYRENNLWHALEEAVAGWGKDAGESVPLTLWPERPPAEGGVCLFEGRVRSLLPLLPQVDLRAVVTAIPRPNQAFWTLSALWAGWLWGAQATRPLKGVLRRRRFDWSWHTTALRSVFRGLVEYLQGASTPVFALLPEAEPGLVTAALLAAEMVGFRQQGVALRVRPHLVQTTWQLPSGDVLPSPKSRPPTLALVREAARRLLVKRGEPGSYLSLHTAVLSSLARQQRLLAGGESPAQAYTHLTELLPRALTYREGFLRYGGSQHSLEVGLWWLRDPQRVSSPLADRVEAALARYLAEHPGATFLQVDTAMCTAFPGLLTPERELVYACLESYGEQRPTDSGKWYLRPEEARESRQRDREEMQAILTRLGERLHFHVHPGLPMSWEDPPGEIRAIFYLQTSAALGEVVLRAPRLSPRAFIVLPGGRANLVAYKLRRNPHLEQAVARNWKFLKFRLLRRLAESPLFNRETMDEQFRLDPLTFTEPQIVLL